MQAESSPKMWTDGFKIVVLMAFEFFPRTEDAEIGKGGREEEKQVTRIAFLGKNGMGMSQASGKTFGRHSQGIRETFGSKWPQKDARSNLGLTVIKVELLKIHTIK